MPCGAAEVGVMKCIGPGNSALGAAIVETGEYVSPPSVEVCTTTFRGCCWLYESSTVWSSTNVIHCRSASAPFDVAPGRPLPFTGVFAIERPLFGDVDVVKPVSAPSPAYAYW